MEKSKETKIKCRNCGHRLIEHIDSKGNKTYLHFNRHYYGAAGINHKWCSKCEVDTRERRTYFMEEVCQIPVPEGKNETVNNNPRSR